MLTLATLLLLGFGFLLHCLKTPRPEHAVYGYLLVWILCPKWVRLANIGNFPGNLGDELFIFDIVNMIAACVLFVVWIARRPRSTPRYAREIKCLIAGFLAMTVVSLLSGIYFAYFWGADLGAIQYYIRPSLTMVYSAIFGAAFLRYINTRQKVERILACFALSGVELTAEAVLLYYFNAVPSARPYVVNVNGRFQSLAYLSFDTVGLVSVVAICSMLYFAITRRSLLLFALMLAMFLPIIATSERAPLSAAGLSLCVVAFLFVRRRYARACFILGICGLSAAVSYLGSNIGDLPTRLNSRLGGVAAANSTVQETLYERVGLWLRSVDIFLYHFPFGTGNGLMEYHMSTSVPARFYGVLGGAAYDNYYVVVNHGHLSNTHNAFLEFVVENGICGVIMLYAWGRTITRRLRHFVVLRGTGYRVGDTGYVAQACLYACMVGMAWRYLFESSDKLYFLLFAILTMISLLDDYALKTHARRGAREMGGLETAEVGSG